MPRRPANLTNASKMVVALRKRRKELENKVRFHKRREAKLLAYIAALEENSNLKPNTDKWKILNLRRPCKIPK